VRPVGTAINISGNVVNFLTVNLLALNIVIASFAALLIRFLAEICWQRCFARWIDVRQVRGGRQTTDRRQTSVFIGRSVRQQSGKRLGLATHRTHLPCSSAITEQARTRTDVRQPSSVGLLVVSYRTRCFAHGDRCQALGFSRSVTLQTSGSRQQSGKRLGLATHRTHLPCSSAITEQGRTRTDVRQPSSVGLLVVGAGAGAARSRRTPENIRRTPENIRRTLGAGAGATRSRRTRRTSARGAALHVFWTRSPQLGSAHGETTARQQRQSTVAGRAFQ